MIDTEQRLALRERQTLGHIDADQQRARQARAMRHSNGVDLVPIGVRFGERRF